MAKNKEIIIGTKFYPFHIMEGELLDIKGNMLKLHFKGEYRDELIKYFPKPITVRFKRNADKIRTIGEAHILDINEIESDSSIIVKIQLIQESILHPEYLEEIKG
ncbi:MAG: hypothetical protein ACOCV8_04095 [Spirochaetota bacterium]